jgi:hypothetical protein
MFERSEDRIDVNYDFRKVDKCGAARGPLSIQTSYTQIKEKNLPQILGQTLFVQGTGKFEFRKIDKYYFCKIFGANSKTRPPTYGLEKP